MLKIYNSLSDRIEEFKPISYPNVTMYVCGPTVYDHLHIGNARPVIFFDILKKYLEFIGYKVKYASNITDVDDKIIEKAIKEKQTEEQIAKKFADAFFQVVKDVGSQIPDITPRATNYINEMIKYIQELIDKGYAYISKSGVYFSVSKIKDYGMLSNQVIDDLESGARISILEEKRDPRDFSLWKITKEGITYDSPFGKGRPGWHTECAVMNLELFKSEIDIHGGGSDLKFPHHENEIAQTIAHDNHHLAKYWVHVGRLDFNKTKMSKSLGNVKRVIDLISEFNPLAFRLLICAHHYRQPINYHDSLMEQFQKEYDKISRTLKKTYFKIFKVLDEAKIDFKVIDDFKKLMDDDFNTPNVVTLLFDLLKQINKETDLNVLNTLYQTTNQILDVLGLKFNFILTDETIGIYESWEKARTNKDYEKADYLRKILATEGWI